MYVAAIEPIIANVVGYAAGLILSYILNRFFTFQSKKNKTIEFLKFLLVFIFSYGLNLLILYLLIKYISINPGYAQVISGFFYIITSYFLQKLIVFK